MKLADLLNDNLSALGQVNKTKTLSHAYVCRNIKNGAQAEQVFRDPRWLKLDDRMRDNARENATMTLYARKCLKELF